MLFPRDHGQVWQKFVDTVTSGEPQVLGLVFGVCADHKVGFCSMVRREADIEPLTALSAV